MKIRYLFYFLFLTSLSFAQDNGRIDINNFNSKLLEHFVKTGVDEVRRMHKCESLINDSILFLASRHHAQYLVRFRKLSHNENDSVSTKTPQLRAEYFGSTNYRVGENILFTPYNTIIQGKDGTKFDTHTYKGMADAMVNAWVNSPGHFKNMITADYMLTGLAVAMDTILGRIYACQKFAIADYQYSFIESKEMFPYSNYIPPQLANSFAGISNKLIEDYKYDFKLKHDKPEDCAKCLEIILDQPILTLRIEQNSFILRVQNSDYIKKLIDRKRDGFAVEIVNFNDYMCGNPAYYTKPSRRNGQLKLNGKILEPVFKQDLSKGYKKRKENKDVKFITYIFKNDSVPFFKRFGSFNNSKYNYQYFELTLGKVPKDLSGYWGHNLVYIQNGQICHIDYLTAYCGEVIQEFQPAKLIPADNSDLCVFEPEKRYLNFSIPFEKGKSEFTEQDINPFIQSISNLSYDIDSVRIHAYSSIEGDSVINRNLQIKRAENIAGILKLNQKKDSPVKITTSANWKDFYEMVAKNTKWNYLGKMDSTEVLNELSKTGYNEIEPILKSGRRADINLYCTIKATGQNLEYIFTNQLRVVQSKLKSNSRSNQSVQNDLDEFRILYECIHSKVVDGDLNPSFLASIKMPAAYRDNHQLMQDFIMYGYEFKDAFSKNKDWLINHKKDEDFIHTVCRNPDHIKPEYLYILIRNAIELHHAKGKVDFSKFEYLIDLVRGMENLHHSDSLAQLNFDRLVFNLNVLLLNSVYAHDPLKYNGNAVESIAQLHHFYKKYNHMNAGTALSLGKTAVYFNQIYQAIKLMTPFATDDSVLNYVMPLQYRHITSEGSIVWYKSLIASSERMDTNRWCNMFFGQCQIPFQAFDYEPLRNVFCEKCMEQSDFIRQLLGRKKNESVEAEP